MKPFFLPSDKLVRMLPSELWIEIIRFVGVTAKSMQEFVSVILLHRIIFGSKGDLFFRRDEDNIPLMTNLLPAFFGTQISPIFAIKNFEPSYLKEKKVTAIESCMRYGCSKQCVKIIKMALESHLPDPSSTQWYVNRVISPDAFSSSEFPFYQWILLRQDLELIALLKMYGGWCTIRFIMARIFPENQCAEFVTMIKLFGQSLNIPFIAASGIIISSSDHVVVLSQLLYENRDNTALEFLTSSTRSDYIKLSEILILLPTYYCQRIFPRLKLQENSLFYYVFFCVLMKNKKIDAAYYIHEVMDVKTVHQLLTKEMNKLAHPQPYQSQASLFNIDCSVDQFDQLKPILIRFKVAINAQFLLKVYQCCGKDKKILYSWVMSLVKVESRKRMFDMILKMDEEGSKFNMYAY